jgi:hypothetical protein
MDIGIVGDIATESGVGQIIYDWSGPTRQHFLSKDYGSGLLGLGPERRNRCTAASDTANCPSRTVAWRECKYVTVSMSDQMKKAAAFLRKGKIFLHPYSRTTQGFWIFSLPVVVADENDEDLGGKLLTILSNSAESVPHPATWKGLTDPLLKAAGVRSFASFTKFANGVDITRDEDGVITFMPTKNGGPRNAFLHLDDKLIRSSAAEEDLESALRAAFAACE